MRIYLSRGILITQPKCFVPFLASYPSVISVTVGVGCKVVCLDTAAPNTHTSACTCLCICANVCVSASISVSTLTSNYLLSVGLTKPRKHPSFISFFYFWGWRESSLGGFITGSCFQYVFSTSSFIKPQISDGHVSTHNKECICFFPLEVQ